MISYLHGILVYMYLEKGGVTKKPISTPGTPFGEQVKGNHKDRRTQIGVVEMIRPYAVAVKPEEGYNLIIDFSNGETRRFVMKDQLDHPFYAPLRDERVFRSVHVRGLSIEWPGGQDVCPDDLYENSIPL